MIPEPPKEYLYMFLVATFFLLMAVALITR